MRLLHTSEAPSTVQTVILAGPGPLTSEKSYSVFLQVEAHVCDSGTQRRVHAASD